MVARIVHLAVLALEGVGLRTYPRPGLKDQGGSTPEEEPMNAKCLILAAVLIVAGYLAWKKYGSKLKS
jgi:hypothetical protein